MNSTQGTQESAPNSVGSVSAETVYFPFQRVHGDTRSNSIGSIEGTIERDEPGTGSSSPFASTSLGMLIDSSDFIEVRRIVVHEVPLWSDRLHRAFRIASTAGASLLVKE
jgi:flagellar motor component MotA